MYFIKTLSRRTLLRAAILVAVFGLALIYFFIIKKSAPKISAPLTEIISNPDIQTANNSGLPIRLKIPSINIDVALEHVGLTPAGALGVPKSTDDVGWFELGKIPGQIGSAVIDGHYGLKNGKPSAFQNLHKLSKGDKIYIENDKGETITFVVRESRSFDPTADASAVFSSDDEKSHLNIITCEGAWNKDTKSFSQRLVVFTDKE